MDEFRLNKEQKEAVRHSKGPLLIIAGAGTGKTTVVTERIKYLIAKEIAKPEEILALTFTEKAAREMQERVDIAMPYGYTQMWISTFHSFCDRVLRSEALQIGLDPDYKLMTTAENIQFVKENLFEFNLSYFRPLGNPTKFIDAMLSHFSRLQDEDVSPKEYNEWVKKQTKSLQSKPTKDEKLELAKWQELSSAYAKYNDLKTKHAKMDYGDLIVKALSLFRQRQNVLKDYKKKFKHVLVDEYQDTNISQNELVKLLAGQDGNLTVVADDDQSIYKWRGASVSNVVQFRKSFPSTKLVTLVKNYRSLQGVLDKAYKIIQFNNPDRLEVVENIDKRLVSQKNGNAKYEFIHTDRVEEEADQVSKKIIELVDGSGYSYSDIAVLVRANNHSEPFVRAFQRRGIPHQFLGPGKLFKQQEVLELIAYLKVLYDFEDSVSLYKVLSMDYFEIDTKDLIKLGNYSKKHNMPLFSAVEQIDDIGVSEDSQKKIQNLEQIVKKHLPLVKKETAGQILYNFLEDSGIVQKLINPDTPDAETKAINISKLFDKLKSFESSNSEADLFSAVDWIDLAIDLGESPLAADTDWTQVDAVNILTIHSSKGLEFPVVFLVNLVNNRFPTINRKEKIPIADELIKEILPAGDHHLQEERRLFYVGLTRAMERFYLTASNYYGEGKREKKLSPFIFETLGEDVVATENQDDTKQLSFVDFFEKKAKKGKKEKTNKLPFHVDYLSYSQIQTFKICPLHFKLKYILKIPTPITSSQSFGNSFHNTMKSFYDAIKKGEDATEELLFSILEKNWINQGYMNKKHEKKSFEKAKKFLSYYLKELYDPKNLPFATEEPFLVKLDGLRIGGKIDRINIAGEKLHVIDYKTGSTPLTQKQADKDLQLSFYALAATKIDQKPFGKKPKNIKLSLYYFDPPQIVTTARTKEMLEDAQKEILGYKKQIENSDFECSGHYFCQNCEFKTLCNA